MNDNNEYIVDNDSQPSMDWMTEDERELMEDIQHLSKKFMDKNIPCFLCAKFSSTENPTAAWHFGKDNQQALQVFAKNIAPLLLYVTSQMTGTKISAINPNNGKLVYEVNPTNENNE